MTGLAIDVAAWSSPWRSRSPGDKALLCCGLVGCALVLPTWPAAPAVLVTTAVLALGPARLSWRVLLRVVRVPAAFIVLAAAPVAVTVRTDPGFALLVTRDGMLRAADLGLHGLAGSAAVLLLAATTPLSDLLPRLRALGVPSAVIEIALLMYRLLFELLDSIRAITEAQTARLGYAGWAAALRSSSGLVAAVLVRSWDRARRLETGLAGRGLEGSLTVLDETAPSDRRFLTASLTGLAALTALSLLCAGSDPRWR
ncbi:MAG: cobalt/nickel transport system permease protein [Actinomycetota bacterium]|nr:cobalt/nickel transport system permease protein [Actinomycetota bacterium]